MRRPRGWKTDGFVCAAVRRDGETEGNAMVYVCTSACKCKGAACVIQRKRETGRPRLRTKAQGRVSSVTEASPLGLLLLGSDSPRRVPIPYHFHPSSAFLRLRLFPPRLLSSRYLMPRENDPRCRDAQPEPRNCLMTMVTKTLFQLGT